MVDPTCRGTIVDRTKRKIAGFVRNVVKRQQSPRANQLVADPSIRGATVDRIKQKDSTPIRFLRGLQSKLAFTHNYTSQSIASLQHIRIFKHHLHYIAYCTNYLMVQPDLLEAAAAALHLPLRASEQQLPLHR